MIIIMSQSSSMSMQLWHSKSNSPYTSLRFP